MASAELRKELQCSICLTVYRNPVNLKCGHSFCRVCIDRVLETQDGEYFCPQCRKRFRDRPELQRNITLCNIVESFWPVRPDHEAAGIFCTYCIHTPVPAVKSCLHCEASLCKNHLRVHSKSLDHVLSDVITSLESRKCSIHKKVLEYYCMEDAACICVSCCLIGEHKGHQMESLDKASETMKKKLRNVQQNLIKGKEETKKTIQSLQEHGRKVHQRAAEESEKVAAVFKDVRRQLEDLEKRVLGEMTRQTEALSHFVSDKIQQLEIRTDELCRKTRHIEELCNMADPLTILHSSDLCDNEEENKERPDKWLHDLDVTHIFHILHKGLFNIVTSVNGGICIPGPEDITLDIQTADNRLHISHDMKTASRSSYDQNRSETLERFLDHPQVLSSQSFSSGQRYWEVDVGDSDGWVVGMCYPSIDRKGRQAVIGVNDKTWGLYRWGSRYAVLHNSKVFQLPANQPINRVRISLDYEAGRISFYELDISNRLLHTSTTTFTEPLHALLGAWRGCIKILGGDEQ